MSTEDGGEHIEEDRLEAYALQMPSEEEAASIEEHLLYCAQCTDRLEQFDHYTRAMHRAATRIREEGRQPEGLKGGVDRLKEWFRHPAPVWGASALLMAGLVVAVGGEWPQKPGAPVDVSLQALRGESTGIAQAGHAIHLHLDNRGLPEAREYNLEIVNEVGSRVWNGTGTWVDDTLQASVEKSFRPGTYFVRVLREGVLNTEKDPLREYQLIVN